VQSAAYHSKGSPDPRLAAAMAKLTAANRPLGSLWPFGGLEVPPKQSRAYLEEMARVARYVPGILCVWLRAAHSHEVHASHGPKNDISGGARNCGLPSNEPPDDSAGDHCQYYERDRCGVHGNEEDHDAETEQNGRGQVASYFWGEDTQIIHPCARPTSASAGLLENAFSVTGTTKYWRSPHGIGGAHMVASPAEEFSSSQPKV